VSELDGGPSPLQHLSSSKRGRGHSSWRMKRAASSFRSKGDGHLLRVIGRAGERRAHVRRGYRMKYPDTRQLPSGSFIGVTVSSALCLFSKRVSNIRIT
jgi:hypothetical protein